MALSCGRRRQRGKNGGGSCSDGAGGCRHFHVHYHLPRRVCAFSHRRLLPGFSLLTCVLISPVLFFTVLAFLVLFVWFTLLYFLRSLWNKDSSNESFQRNSNDHSSDADKLEGEDFAEEAKAEEKAVMLVSELSEESAAAEYCAKRFEIEEVHVNSDESEKVLRIASSDACVNYDVHTDDGKLIEEVIIFEIKMGEREAIASSDGLSERDQVQDLPIGSEEEIKSRDAIKSGESFPLVLSTISAEFHDYSEKNEAVGWTMNFLDEKNQHMAVLLDTSCHRCIGDGHGKYDEDFFYDKEVPTFSSSETSDFIDKNETREVVLEDCENDDTVTEFAAMDGSAHDWIQYEQHSTEQKDANNLPGLLVDNVAIVSDEQKEIQKTVIVDDTKLPDVLFLDEKQIVSSSDELGGCTSDKETSVFPFGSVCQDGNGTMAYSSASSHYNVGVTGEKCEDLTENNIEETSSITFTVCCYASSNQITKEAPDSLANGDSIDEVADNKYEDLTGNKIEEVSSIASAFCGYAYSNQPIQEAPDCLANGDNIDVEEDSLESSIHESVKDKDDKSNGDCTSKGASDGMPLVRRSPAPWWNFCGVIDVFAGCND